MPRSHKPVNPHVEAIDDPVNALLELASERIRQTKQEEAITATMPFAFTDWGRFRQFRLGEIGSPLRLIPENRKRLLSLINTMLKDGIPIEQVKQRAYAALQEML